MSTHSFVKSVVKTCLHIGKDDRVAIFAWRHTLDMAEAFAIESKKTGAQVHTEFTTDEMFYGHLFNLPLDQIKAPDPFALALLDVSTANIFTSGPENPDRLKQVPPEKWNAMSKADKPFYDRILEKKIRSAQITLGYVTPYRAKTYGFNYDEWKENVNAALDVKYEDMRRFGEKIRDAFERAQEVHITTPKGTDLTFSLEDRPIHIYDGVIDDQDVEKGAIFTTLPSGTVHLAPIEPSANGLVLADVPEPQLGILPQGMKWVFKDGKVVSFEGGNNIEVVKKQWEKASGDKDRIGWLALGINPKAKIGFAHNTIVLGTATVGIGDNRELGGKNESNYGTHLTVLKPTIELDGKPVIKRGEFAF